MAKLLKQAGHALPESKPILEINPDHPIIARLKEESDDERFADWSEILFEQSMLSEGGQLDDPASYVSRLNSMMLHLMK